MINTARGRQGFTLLEILIAMAVFALMASMAYAGLRIVLKTREATETRSENLAKMQHLFYLISEDLNQALARPVRDELGSDELAFSGGNRNELLVLTRSIVDWTGVTDHSLLQRIRYLNEKGGIYRQVWTLLDRTQQTESGRKMILQTESIKIRFYGQDWETHWPLAGESLPKAVEITVQLPDLGEVRRLFAVQE